MSTNTFIAIALVLAIGYLLLRRGGDISSADARELMKEGARLVDVRTPQEFASGHIPGAINIPVQELPSRLAELDGKAQPVVLYCRSGSRSSSAARLLEKAGYTKVHNLGAMTRW